MIENILLLKKQITDVEQNSVVLMSRIMKEK